MTGIFLLLGSNLGDKINNLKQAQNLLEQEIGQVLFRSSIYCTEAWGMQAAPSFLNRVLVMPVTVTPQNVLDLIGRIEISLGRKPQKGYQDRTIDIDILYFEDLVIDHPELIVPHPRIPERRFVLEPLVEIAPDFVHPVMGHTNLQLLDRCTDRLMVKKLKLDNTF